MNWLNFAIFIIFAGSAAQEQNIPLAPYNVKVMCRQGRRFTKSAQNPNQCPSSSTACAFFEFPMTDSKTSAPSLGVYECVDGGIMEGDLSGEDELDHNDVTRPQFADLCGAVPRCSSLAVELLNPAFVKYLVTEYDIKLEGLEDTKIRFCCALFHSTLQKLVTSGLDVLPQPAAPPVSCFGQQCGAGAVGCLLHTSHEEQDYEYEEDKRRRRRRRQLEDSTEYVNAVELSFDDFDVELVTREPPLTTTAVTSLPSLKLPMFVESTTTTSPAPSTSRPPKKVYQHDNDDYHSEDGVDEDDPFQDTHCVYRHLNDEFYRYCLLVHQGVSRDGDRCYHHQGHTICCCFVPPDRETCDPTEMDLVVPPPPAPTTPRVLVTIPPTTPSTTTTTSTTSTTTTSTTSTTSTTTTSTTTTPEAPTTTTSEVQTTTSYFPHSPPQVYRLRPIDQTKNRKKNPRKCRVAYVRTKTGAKTRPVLVCDAVASRFYHGALFLSLFLLLRYF